MKLTGWYRGDQKPLLHRPGVYECEWEYQGCVSRYYNYWDGYRWHYGETSPDAAYNIWCDVIIADQRLLRWRGVAK